MCLAAFADRLLSAQRPCVHTVRLARTSRFRETDGNIARKPVIQKLSGIKDLTYTIEVEWPLIGPLPEALRARKLFEEMGQTFE